MVALPPSELVHSAAEVPHPRKAGLCKLGARPLVDLKRGGLATHAVERRHELSREALTGRPRGQQCFEFGDGVGTASEFEVSIDPGLQRD